MSGSQPKPPLPGREDKPAMQQVPRVKLQAVVNLDGVSSEPLLIYENKPAKARLGKTQLSAVQPGSHTDTPRQQHHRQVATAARSLVQNLPKHLEAVAREQHQQHSEIRERSGGERSPQKEASYERQ